MSRAGKSSKSGTRRTSRKQQLKLPEVLDMTAATPLAQSFLSHRGAALSVDASDVRRVGAQCLQVILAAAETWKADGKQLSLVKPSPEFLEGGQLLGAYFDEDLTLREQLP